MALTRTRRARVHKRNIASLHAAILSIFVFLSTTIASKGCTPEERHSMSDVQAYLLKVDNDKSAAAAVAQNTAKSKRCI